MPPPPLHVSFLLSCLLTLVSSTSSALAISTSTSSASAISTEDANSTTTQLHAGATGDRQALLCFKSQLSDPAGVLASWSNTSLDVCSWHGVTCNMSQASHVTELNLENSQLSGTIPPCIANLTFLEAIRFPNNNLRGHIPSELGQLRRLWHLNLSTNSLNGNIPSSFGRIPSLVYLDLAGNGLTGQLPESLATSSSLQVLKLRQNNLGGDIPGFLFNTSSLVRIDLRQNNFSGIIPPVTKIVSSLKYLSLSGNKLSGSIPASLRNLSSLSYLYLDQNNLVGSIPESLAGIQSLRRLALTANKLSGLVPPSLYNVSTLVDLDLSHNLLLGRLPDDIGNSLSSIEWLILEDKFEGPVPASLANASSLQVLDLANNSFSGAIPLLGSLQNLSYLDFSINQLEAQDWAFLSSLSNCTQLTKLCLMSNNFEGSLPSSIGKLPTKLGTLWLNLNKISGAIPLEIGNLTSLTVLLMQDNLFSGSIPSVIGALRNMSVLSLSRNNLSGPIPDSFSNLEQLSELYLGGNKLSGNIPTSLGNCKNLQMLNLSHNSLDGSIPIELLKISSLSEGLGLSHNSLTGPIPQEVGRLINLGRLMVSYNQLSGQIPSSLGQCVVLEFLHMEGNILHGSIPESFMSLKGIKEMALSQNNLSGEIPEFLASFTSLYSLNLSFNDFSGAVPTKGVFANTTEVSIQGNKRLCARVPMLRLPLCSEGSKAKHQSITLKIVIPLAVVAAVSLLSCFVAVLLKRRAAQPSAHNFNEKVKVSYEDIVKATNRFSPANLLGSGSFGTVYTGRFQFNVNPVAIKVFNLKLYGASRSFVAECEALRSIRHRNLVKVITSCSTVDHTGIEFKALIFQYMPNGNLDMWLHPKIQVHDQTKVLSLGQRISIALDVAFALDYLHNQAVCPLVHCDLKPQNILLDFDKNAYVSDFGLSRFLCSNSILETTSSTNLTGLKGSIGYIAPEYGMGTQISTEGDVYSYGVLLLELLTGKRPTDETFKNDLSLHKFVHSAFPDRIGDVLDPFLLQESTEYGNLIAVTLDSFIIPLIKLGLLCSTDSPKDRPRMEHVATEIRMIKSSFRA